MRIILTALLFAALNVQAAEIKVSGGAAPMNNIFKLIKGSFEKKTGHTLVLNEQSAELALQALDKGETHVASAGLKQEDWLKLCKEKKITIDESKPYKFFAIGKDSILVFANKKSSVKELSFAQLEKIFTGQVTSWKEFRGDDKPIKVVFSQNIAGTNKLFSKSAMNGKDYRKDVVEAKNAEDIMTQIGKDPDTIGIGPVGVDLEKFGVKVLKSPEISRPIFMAYLSTDASILELQRYLGSPEGQNLMKR